MEAKTFEVRDAMTFLPVVAVKLSPDNKADEYLMKRCGYPIGIKPPYVILTRLAGDGSQAHYDPSCWNSRTLNVAHDHIQEHWDVLPSGSVVDVQFILGETAESKPSEASQAFSEEVF